MSPYVFSPGFIYLVHAITSMRLYLSVVELERVIGGQRDIQSAAKVFWQRILVVVQEQ